MIWTITEIIAILAECILFTHLLVNYFDYKKPTLIMPKNVLLFTLLSTVDLVGTFIIKREIFFITGIILIEILFSYIFLNGNRYEKLFISILTYILVYFANLPVLFITAQIAKESVSNFVDYSENVERVIALCASKLIYFLLVQCILMIHKSNKAQLGFKEWSVVIASFLITLTIDFGMYLIAYGSELSSYIMMGMSILLCALDVFIYIFVQKLNVANRAENERRMLALQISQKQEEMINLERQYRELSVVRHDFMNQVNTLHDLLTQENTSEALKYISAITDRGFYHTHHSVQCNSSVINAVINTRFHVASDCHIKVSCRMTASVPKYLEYDIGIILSNLLDNAIEACQKQSKSEKEVLVYLSITGGYYRIVVKNTIDASVLNTNRQLRTSKIDKLIHGWGLKSVADLVDANHGFMDYYEKDGYFVVNTMLQLREE